MKKDIKKNVLEKIQKGDVKIKSKNWFHFVKFGFGCLIAVLGVIAIVATNYALYIPKRMGAFRQFSPNEAPLPFSPIPWVLIVVSILVIAAAVWIYKEYENGYKKNIALILLVSIIFVLFLGFILAFSGINESLEHNPQMRRFHDWQEDSFGPKHRRPRVNMME